MFRIKPIGARLARATQRSQSLRLERAGPDLPRKVRPRISAWYYLYVEATIRNLILPDLPQKPGYYCTTYILLRRAYFNTSTVQYISILQIENTIHCNTLIQKYNILQYSSLRSAIQYIAIPQISDQQYNILQYLGRTIQYIAIL